MLELWDELCDSVMQMLSDHSPEQVDDLLTVTHYLTGLMALYLLQLSV